MEPPIPTADEVLECAVSTLLDRYPEAQSAFVAGSFMRGEGSATSDIDLVVLYSSLPQAYRESFQSYGIRVEAFVHDPETLAWFLEQDRRDGRPAMIGMLCEGRLIGPRQNDGIALKQRAERMLAAGPPALSADGLLRLRYAITDKLDDLEADRTRAEILAIGAALYPVLVELVLRGSGRWNGSGKWNARLLLRFDPALSEKFETAFQSLYRGEDTRPVSRLADEVLEQHGGRLFAGYRSDAPTSWRVACTSPEG